VERYENDERCNEERYLQRVGVSLPVVGVSAVVVGVGILCAASPGDSAPAVSLLVLGSMLLATYAFVFGLRRQTVAPARPQMNDSADEDQR
jgi:hypothetical protein